MLDSAERADRRLAQGDDAARFARYDTLFDALYWLGAEQALRGAGVPWWDVGVRRPERWIRHLSAAGAD